MPHSRVLAPRVKLGATVDLSQNFDAISDTGTSFLAGPPIVVLAIARELGATLGKDTGVYQLPCPKAAPPLRFLIAGREFAIQPNNYILPLPVSNIFMSSAL